MHFDLDRINLPIHEIPKVKKIIIYGVGDIAEKYTELIGKKYGDNKIEFYLVSEINTDTKFHEKEILSFERLKELKVNDYYYIIASFSAVRTMKKKLYQYEIKEENIHETVDFWSVEVMREIKDEIKDVYFYPKIETIEQFMYFSELIKDLPNDHISYHVSLDTLLYQKNFKKFPSTFICSNEVYEPNQKDFVFVWNKDHLFDSEIKKATYKFCIDKSICKSNTTKIINCYLSNINEKSYIELSKKNLKELAKYNRGKVSIVFGNGPSLDSFLEFFHDMNKTYMTVVCNQMFLNEKAMNQIKPDVYLLYDQAYFQNENEQVLKNILNTIHNLDCYFVVPFLFIPLLINRKDINKNKMIGIDIYGEHIQFIRKDNLVVKRMYSVITTLAIPLASYISSEICFVGCDGKKKMENEEQFWSYAATLKEEIECIKYGKIPKGSNEMILGYNQHCNEFENLISYGENLGKTYCSLTKSYIPVLMKHYKKLY